MEYFKLRNNLKLPAIGIGTWQITDRTMMRSLLKQAYNDGYSLIDTAAAYLNEIAIAKAIKESDLFRNELIICDKVWNTYRGFEAVQTACKNSLKKLKTDYLDLYLIHWPAMEKFYPDWEKINAETWRGMEALYKSGIVKAIGVCNFEIYHLEALKKTAEVMPFVNQFECHVGLPQNELIEYCKNNQIQVIASSPLGNGQILNNEKLVEIAKRTNKSVAQLCLRWLFQKGLVSIPKTSNIKRLSENINIFDFNLTDEEISIIDSIPYCGGLTFDLDEVTEFGFYNRR